MPRKAPKRILSAIDDLTSAPPDPPLPLSQVIGRISQAQGKNLFTCVLPSSASPSPAPSPPPDNAVVLAELAPIFRNKAWLRRGGYVLIDTAAFEGRDNKIGGQIVNVVRNEKDWRKMEYWPKEFTAPKFDHDVSEDEESTVGKLPPNSDDEE